MTSSRQRPAPTWYQLRVHGQLDAHWSPWFAGLTVAPDSDGTTSLTGVVADQAQLHGLLAKVRDLGLTLLSVQVYDPTTTLTHPSPAKETSSGCTQKNED